MKQWTIYKHTSLQSGKSYVGLTQNTPLHRWKEHISAAKNGSPYHFHRAIRLYGPDNWELEILATDIHVLETAIELEKYYISKEDTFENGYNSTIGGEGVATISEARDTARIFKHADGTVFHGSAKELQSEFNVPCIGNIDKLILGTRFSMYGWQIVSDSNDSVKLNPTEGRVIYKYTAELEYVDTFYSAMQAAKSVNIVTQDKIYNRCKTNYISQEFKGYRWSFLSPEELQNKIDTLGETVVFHYKGVLRVFNHENGSEFIGKSRALSELLDCSESVVSNMVHKGKQHKGWSYIKDLPKDTDASN